MIYLLADDLMAVDRKTRALRWSIRLPTTLGRKVVLGREVVLVPSSRGLYELSREKGDRQRIFRGEDVALLSGSLGVVQGKYLCVTNQAITVCDAAPPRNTHRKKSWINRNSASQRLYRDRRFHPGDRRSNKDEHH
jgi:hypothetical protein